MTYRPAVVVLCAVALFSATLRASEGFTNSVGMKMIPVEAGMFEMGSDGEKDCWWEKPKHKVTISRGFYVSEMEVTVEQFKRYKADFAGTSEFYPYAAGVSWHQAVAFCIWLSKQEGKPYRLPTEAEWEYACRAGKRTPYCSGKERPKAETANDWEAGQRSKKSKKFKKY